MLDLDPSKVPPAVREKREAARRAREEGQQEVEAAILDYPMEEGQEELIQRAIGVINPIGVRQIIAQIDVRPDRDEIIQQIFTQIEKEEDKIEIAELGETQAAVHFDYKPRIPVPTIHKK